MNISWIAGIVLRTIASVCLVLFLGFGGACEFAQGQIDVLGIKIQRIWTLNLQPAHMGGGSTCEYILKVAVAIAAANTLCRGLCLLHTPKQLPR